MISGDHMAKVTSIFFSPSETTKKVVNQIAENFKEEKSICDLLYFNDKKEFESDDIVIVGMPVFAGRLPKTASERLSKLTGNNTKAIAVANYGNAHVKGDIYAHTGGADKLIGHIDNDVTETG